MGFRDEVSGLLTGSTAVTVPMMEACYPATVAVVPGSGDSVLCEYTIDGAAWTAWGNNTATAFSIDVLDGPVRALRFTRTAGSSATSKYLVIPRRD